MHILFAGGGSAGHVNPALAVAGYIMSVHPDAKISYIGTADKLESRLVPEAGYDFYTIDVAGFQRKVSPRGIKRNISAVHKMFKSSSQARRLLKALQPDIVMGTGGYVSGPVLRQAAKMGFKTAIHESNAFPGVTTKMLSPKVDAVMLAMPEAASFLNCKSPPIITGNPVRESIINAKKETARAVFSLDRRPMILSYGGSLGARRINETVAELIAFHMKSEKFYHFHATGKTGYEETLCLLDEKAPGWRRSKTLRVSEYIDDMDVTMAAADLVICRAGAMTLSELAVQGKPSILIPSPYVAENHQYYNAMALKNKESAELIEEKELTAEKLIQTVIKLITNQERLSQMGDNMKKSAIFDVSKRIYSVLMELSRSM